MANRVYQFKIQMKEISPPIWRRIVVPEAYNFWDLHVAIQDSMGWKDYHLHMFRIRRKHAHSVTEIGIPNEDRFEGEPEIVPGWEVPITDYFYDVGVTADYDYDFGDDWKHEVLFEGILLKQKGTKYPICIDGERACPPEDCGGVGGYYELLEIISDPSHEEHEGMITWLGKKYDPDEFMADKVKFENPRTRWRIAFTENT